jgi:hypothetical protein
VRRGPPISVGSSAVHLVISTDGSNAEIAGTLRVPVNCVADKCVHIGAGRPYPYKPARRRRQAGAVVRGCLPGVVVPTTTHPGMGVRVDAGYVLPIVSWSHSFDPVAGSPRQ